MNGDDYLKIAYVIGLVLLWGYVISLWIQLRKDQDRTRRRESRHSHGH